MDTFGNEKAFFDSIRQRFVGIAQIESCLYDDQPFFGGFRRKNMVAKIKNGDYSVDRIKQPGLLELGV